MHFFISSLLQQEQGFRLFLIEMFLLFLLVFLQLFGDDAFDLVLNTFMTFVAFKINEVRRGCLASAVSG